MHILIPFKLQSFASQRGEPKHVCILPKLEEGFSIPEFFSSFVKWSIMVLQWFGFIEHLQWDMREWEWEESHGGLNKIKWTISILCQNYKK
jgi:hypothetical protein